MMSVDWEAEKRKLSNFIEKHPDFTISKHDHLRPNGVVCIAPMPDAFGKYSRALIAMHPDVYDMVKTAILRIVKRKKLDTRAGYVGKAGDYRH